MGGVVETILLEETQQFQDPGRTAVRQVGLVEITQVTQSAIIVDGQGHA